MTDFCITRVRYDPTGQRIAFLEVSENLPNKFGDKYLVPRGFVADLIRMRKATFSTWVSKPEGGYKLGAQVHIFDETYLATDRNSSKKDNLSSLPTF